MAIEHDSIVDTEVHEPRLISTAALGEVYVANGVGSGDWLTMPTLLTGTAVLGALDFTNQNPSGTDNPLQIKFGSAQGSGATPLQLDAAGAVTVNETGLYFVLVRFSVGRTSGTGVARVLFRQLVNGVQVGAGGSVNIGSADATLPAGSATFQQLTQGQVLTWECARDSSGNDSGGLLTFTPTTLPWTPSPSAFLVMNKMELA